MTLRKQIHAKLRSKQGESIGEVLIALLISSLALVMLAGMIFSSGKMITDSRDKMDEYYSANNTLDAQTGTATSGTVKILTKDGAGNVSESGYLSDPAKNEYSASCYTNSVIGKNNPVAYKVS